MGELTSLGNRAFARVSRDISKSTEASQYLGNPQLPHVHHERCNAARGAELPTPHR